VYYGGFVGTEATAQSQLVIARRRCKPAAAGTSRLLQEKDHVDLKREHLTLKMIQMNLFTHQK